MGDLKSQFVECYVQLYIYICTHIHVCVYVHILFNIKFNTICNVPEFSSTSCQQISLDSQKLSHIRQCDSPHSSCHGHSKRCVLFVQSIWLSKSQDNVTNIWLFFQIILGQKLTVLPSLSNVQKCMKHHLFRPMDGAVLCPHPTAPT